MIRAIASRHPDDAVLAEVNAGPGRSVVEWTRQLFPRAGELVALALERLQGRGVIEAKEARFLWVLRSRRYPVIEGRELQEAKLRITDVLLGGAIPSPHDSVLIGLASISGLLRGFLSRSRWITLAAATGPTSTSRAFKPPAANRDSMAAISSSAC